jgi:hypothetical protein
MTDYMTFEIDELPLVIADGVEAGLVNGKAELEYSRDGEWLIIGITLDASTSVITKSGKRRYPQVDCPAVIAAIIDERLNKEWRDHVQCAVREQIEADREDAKEAYYEARRERA